MVGQERDLSNWSVPIHALFAVRKVVATGRQNELIEEGRAKVTVWQQRRILVVQPLGEGRYREVELSSG